ncbi:Serine/threonine-protein kinase tnni3k [Marasmius tenuissimus]|nr:Serine/threonine-protein kinase tnni3k [Marasmius tenuissimus]
MSSQVNVLITPGRNACITDFGLSQVTDSNTLGRQGPARWLAPELLKTGKRAVISLESDIYAFGCVCYEIYTRRAPFEDVEEYGIHHIVVVQDQRPELPRPVPDGMRRLIEDCWHTEPGSRPKAVNIADELGRDHGGRPDRNEGLGRNKPAY